MFAALVLALLWVLGMPALAQDKPNAKAKMLP